VFHSATLIDADWSSGTQTPGSDTFSKIDNGRGGGGTWDQTTGVITQAAENYSAVGMSSDTLIDFTAVGTDKLVLTATIATRTGGALNANGIFIGFQNGEGGDGGNLWNNNGPSFGLVINGNTRGPLNEVAPGGYVSAGFQTTNVFNTIASQASIDSGFTVVLSVDSAGWNFTITGLEADADGAAITGGSGVWADIPEIGWSDLVASSSMHAAISSQGNAGVVTLARMSVTQGTDAPEPVDPPVVIAIRHLGTTVEVDATNLVSSVEYQLVRSADLASGSITNVVDGPLTPGSDTKTFMDPAPLDGAAFYRVQTTPEPAQ
jgi:hypothetical protein